jgi:crcB protein
MMHLVAVALGGALGALGRYGVNGLLYPVGDDRFPLGTLAVNVIGSFVMGLLYVLIVEKAVLPPEWRNFLMIGFLGAFTTFSTFSLDVLALFEGGHYGLGLVYLLLSLFLCIGGIALAIFLARLIPFS